ncbi:beta-Ala-His dipeptidase [Drosophila grimshawi]|uniref:GH11456 n=1 Tax=Drosophila grimshawi TaxID=7222 RepID=B4JAG7_DROGR|nr:beta-Ala-His dipeptidase [Drosophila grimshawi]EDW03838.1 GH11456 [Drosophila grimshawi]
MICWGERNCCGIFLDGSKDDRCDCLRDYCVRDYDPKDRIIVAEEDLEFVNAHLKTKSEAHLTELNEMISLKSIPDCPEFDKQTRQLINRLAQRLNELEFDVEVVEVKPKGTDPTHYVIFASYFSTPAKNVMLVYGHVDVKNVDKDDNSWTQFPFKLTNQNGMLYGRGLTSSKGPLYCWLHAAESWLEGTDDLPVNLRFLIDTFSNANNQALRELIDQRQNFFKPVDLLICSTNLWISPKTPMLSICHSGYVFFELRVRHKKQSKQETESDECPTRGRQPMEELCFLMNTLTDKHGELAKKLERHALPVTQNDWNILSKAEMGIMEFKESYNIKELLHEESKALFLKHRWCMPCLTVHTVEHRQYSSVRDLYEPRHILAKFSVKLVPDQSIDYVKFVVREHLDCAYCRHKCIHPAYLRITDSVKPLNEGRNAPFSLAAQRAYEQVYNVHVALPDTITLCLPMMNVLRKHCLSTAQVIGLPFCSVHMHPGQSDECIPLEEYERNKKLCATLMYELALVPPECKCTEVKDFCYEPGKSTDRDFVHTQEPRNANISHILYELNEAQVDKAHSITYLLPNVEQILLGNSKNEQKQESLS